MRARGSVARNGIAAAVAVLTAAGYLLVSGALDPALRGAVTLALGPDDDPALQTTPISDWMYFDDRPEWSSLRKVPKLPTRPDQPVDPVRPEVAPPENPHRWQFTAPGPMPHYALKPPDSCFQPRGPGTTVERLTAIAGTGSATVTWWDLGDPDTRSYELAIVPVGAIINPIGAVNTPIRYLTIPAPNTCKQITVNIPGLRSGEAYRFWLLANNESQVQKRNYRPSRGETESITIN
ncbi:MAG TPA: hypothetical protein VLL08_12980 [Kineosporiaceae bacterium]|nr:hypothetical protein [Kineosporiaceae bacterium]